MDMSSGTTISGQAPAHQHCRNCQACFQGKFCPECGQSVNNYERPLRFLIVDFAGNVFAFDTRVWRSLLTLLFRPGKMETDYTAGKRARYMPPFRMYIFMSFLFFLLLSNATNLSVQKNRDTRALAVNEKNQPDSLEINRFPESVDYEEINHILQQNSPSMFTPEAPGGKYIANIQHILDNPEGYLSRFFRYLSWALFLLMPLYGFFLWIFFRKSREYYLSHFLLSCNHHVFIFMILIVMMLIHLVFPSKEVAPETYLLYLIPVYSLTGARKLYQSSWIKTLLKLATVQVIYALLTACATALVVYFSFFG